MFVAYVRNEIEEYWKFLDDSSSVSVTTAADPALQRAEPVRARRHYLRLEPW
jgi:hypothetical protein